MYPYYIFKIKSFDKANICFNTNYQLGIDSVENDRPNTSFQKRAYQILEGFTKYDFSCELEQRIKGRAYGENRIFEKFILIKEDVFYLSEESDILIMSSNKKVFNKFYKDMEKVEKYSLDKIDIDFQDIVKNIKSLGIQSVWLGRLPDEFNITTLSMYGVNIEDSTKYTQLLKSGAEIKNLSLIYEYEGNQERIMITKDGGVILYRNMDESDALLLIEDVYKNMLTPNS